MERTSLWHGTARAERHPPLSEATETDVVVVGGGITGLTTAALLVEAGVGVVVLEARELASGTTGGTTGKLTSQHGMIYGSLVRGHGEPTARLYGQANQAAIQQVHDLCSRNGIDAELEPETAYVYAQTEDAVGGLRREYTTARRLGLPAEWTLNTDLPFAVAGALRFTDQAQMHAVKYCIGLARMIVEAPHGAVHCQTRVTGVRERGHRVVVETERGVVVANDVVLATLLPITNRGLEFARAKAMRSYGIAAAASGELTGMYISAEQPTRSIRHHRAGDDLYLVVAGESHEVGHETETQRHDDALTAFARENFGIRELAYRWSSHDYVPDDRLPLVGTTALSQRIYVATGFQKWGLTNAMAAARLVTDLIQGRANPLAAMFSPKRVRLRASARQFLEHNGDVAIRFVGDRVKPAVSSVEDIPPGGGATVRVNGQLLAVSRDRDGTITSRSATCSHLGCVVQWNGVERSWDCPCHGSRFAETGEVLDGPATQPLDDG